MVDSIPPTVMGLFPGAGVTVRTLSQIEVTFSEEVAGVNAGDLLINNQPATAVTHEPAGPYVFQFPAVGSGSVNVRWATGHGIVDLATVPNPFSGGTWSYTVDPNVATGNLVINEILASNQSGLADEDGEPSDWIELYNGGGAPVNLAGWSLSDDPEIPGLWVFPSVSIGPGQYLIVFASGKNRTVVGGTNRLHTNFQMGGDGEFLGLYSADSPRVLTSSLGASYPEQRNDYSFGRDLQGSSRFFSVPTPGSVNGSSTITGVAESVHFSASRGFYNQPFDLHLTCATPGTTIRYTLDATEPTVLNGRIYGGPLRLTNTTLVRASAFRANLLPSKVSTHSYLFHLTPAQRTLPVISLVTAQSNWTGRAGIVGMFPETGRAEGTAFADNPSDPNDYHNPSQHGIAWERPVSAEYLLPDGSTGFQIDCGIRVQGSDWQRPRTVPNSKYSFRLYFRGEYGPGRLEYPMFPLSSVQSFDQLVLRAGFNEKINPFVRDEVVRRISHDMGQVASHGDVLLVLRNGGIHTNDPGGSGVIPIYNPTERVHSEMMQSYLGGGSKWDVVAPDFATSAEGLGIIDGDRVDFRAMMTNFWSGSALRPITTPAAYQRVAQRVDLPNFVDYCLLNSYVAMGDWPANNWRAARERSTNGIWRFIAWDAEWGMGIYTLSTNRDSFAFAGTGTEDAGLASTGNSEIARIYQALRQNPEFRLLFADRVHKHMFVRGGALTSLNVSNRIHQLRERVSGFIPFANFEQKLRDWPGGRPGVFVPQLNTYGLYGLSNAAYGFFASSNAPVLSQHGGRAAPGYSLTMSAPLGGTIYYTTNGHDPRVPFSGAVSNAAAVYAGPIVLMSSVPIKARTLMNGTNWSAVADATFDVGVLGTPIRFTEVMYNPLGGAPYEYLELQNIGSTAVDLSGFFFSEGITFTFLNGTTLGAGARLVLANNTDSIAFAGRYPGVNVTGYFAGNLNNAGERLTLANRAGDIITSVDYRDTGGWPVGADGSGSSLELVDAFGDPNDPANWRSHPAASGTPGSANAPVPAPSIEISEVLAENVSAVDNAGTFPDYIELSNPGGAVVSLAGWSLTDDGEARKFVFPAGTQIAAQGRLLVWLDAVTNTTPGLHAGFSLEKNGDSVFLFNASTGLVDAVSLGLQIANFSAGRLDGQWSLHQPTPNAPNAVAVTAPAAGLRLNEWLANPAAGQDDWIELYNPAAQPVSLRGVYLSNGASTHRVTSLSFIAAGGFVQLLADESAGVDHLNFRLAAAGATISLSDAAAVPVDSVTYTNAVEGLSRGRLPDGAATLANFPGSTSPGAANYQNTYTGPALNEVLARNFSVGSVTGDYVELFNPGSTFDLSGMSLSVNSSQAGEWVFPAGTLIGGGGYLVVRCDDTQPPSTVVGFFNTGEALDGESGGVYLFNAAGQVVDSIEYGFQIADLSIGRVSGQWRLLNSPTPGLANAAATPLGATSGLRVNEWMANPPSGSDWFELHNTGGSAVDMAGLLLTDDPSITGVTQFRITPLSFIASGGFVKWVADGNASEGRNHVSFNLDAAGESILVVATNGTNFVLVDGVSFAAQQLGTAQGRLPDGSAGVVSLPRSATPGESNYQPAPVVINEVLTREEVPVQSKAIELFNPGSQAVNVGGWYVSSGQDNFKQLRIPDGQNVPPGGYLVINLGFGQGSGFTLDGTKDGEVWLSAADGAGNLTGHRAGARFGPTARGVSFGRVVTSVGVDYAPLETRSFGSANGPLRLGPVVIQEIHYNPAGSGEEFIELANLGATPAALFDPANPANTWRLSGGIHFQFPANTLLAPGAYALVVPFDPANSIALSAFRSRYEVAAGVPIFGPYLGRLANDSDSVLLVRPDAPELGFVPYLAVDRADYADAPPWPAGAVDGGGYSMQRRAPLGYGNEPVNWVAAEPTAGAPNGIGSPPAIVSGPQSASVLEGQTLALTVSATGNGPLTYQWRFNGATIPNATNAALVLDYPVLEDEGAYDAIVSNPVGSAVTGSAVLVVRVPPIMLNPPVNVATQAGSNIVFTAVARGSAPLQYQWRLNGVDLPGRTSPTLSLSNVQLSDDGVYELIISNPYGTTVTSARLDILIRPVVTVAPVSQSVVPGQTITLSVEATGNPLPFTFEWRRGSTAIRTNVLQRRNDYISVTITNMSGTDRYRAVIKNLALTVPGVASAEAIITILPDADGDGLPDAWETQYGSNPASAADRNADTDGDTMTNWEEYVAGTEPNDAASYLRVGLGAVPGTATVSFNAVATKTYSILYTDDLISGAWSKLQDIVARATTRTESVVDRDWRAQRTYKLVTPSQ